MKKGKKAPLKRKREASNLVEEDEEYQECFSGSSSSSEETTALQMRPLLTKMRQHEETASDGGSPHSTGSSSMGSPIHKGAEKVAIPPLSAERQPYRKKLTEGEPGTLSGRPLRLYADGIFDLFHFGHARALQQCKEAYPKTYLLVGCNNDKLTHKLKGMTVMNDEERYESLRHCKWVDEVVENAPWVLTDEFLEKHQIDYVCHDALPYTDSSGKASEGDVYARIKKMGKFLETKRTEGISTTELIIRIISEYDTFIRRNLQRGYTRKDMNVPFMKEQSIKLDMALQKATKKTKKAVEEVDELLQSWLIKSIDLRHEFVELFSKDGPLFSKDGPLRTSLRKRRRIIKKRLEEVARESFC